MGIPLKRGTVFADELSEESPVPMIVSESAADRLWPGEDPVNRRIRLFGGESVVVGVVGDVRQVQLAQDASPGVYLPQQIAPRLLVTLLVRTRGDPLALAGPIRAAIREIDPNQPIHTIAPLRTVMAESIARDRFFTVLFAAFGGLALILAAVGIYGVLAYSVRQRTQEIGVRMALGARVRDIRLMIASAGLRLVVVGAAMGGMAALAFTRILASQLYGVKATDPVTFAGVIGFLIGVGFLTSYVPAVRATRVSPMAALGSD